MNYHFISLAILGTIDAVFGIILFILRISQRKSKLLANAIITFSCCSFLLGIAYTVYMIFEIQNSHFSPLFSINRLFILHGIFAFILAALGIGLTYLKNKIIPEKLKNALAGYSQKDMSYYTTLEKALILIQIIAFATVIVSMATFFYLLFIKSPGWFLFYIPNTIVCLLPTVFIQVLYY